MSGCLTFIVILCLAAFIISLWRELFLIFAIAFLIISLASFILTYIKHKNNLQLIPTFKKCPDCGSENIKIRSIKTGEVSSSNISATGESIEFNFLGNRTLSSLSGRHNQSTEFCFKREGICQECGFNFNYYTLEDIENIQTDSKNRLTVVMLFLAISMIVFIVSCVNFLDNSFDSSVEDDASVWANGYTPINQFDYYLDGNNIYLKEYEGNLKKIRLSSTYDIDGVTYNLISFTDAVFLFDNVYSVILPDGLVSMPSNTFNSCDVKYIYIPETLQPDNKSYSFYSYFHDVEKIYYGGTEEQWKKLTNNAQRSEIDAKEIVYNVDIEKLK